jgi:hypothetical protein
MVTLQSRATTKDFLTHQPTKKPGHTTWPEYTKIDFKITQLSSINLLLDSSPLSEFLDDQMIPA